MRIAIIGNSFLIFGEVCCRVHHENVGKEIRKLEEKKDYKYLLLLKNEREQEKKTIEILKKQGNVKEYLIRAITYYEEQFEREKEKKETMDFLKEEMKSIKNEIEKIRINTSL